MRRIINFMCYYPPVSIKSSISSINSQDGSSCIRLTTDIYTWRMILKLFWNYYLSYSPIPFKNNNFSPNLIINSFPFSQDLFHMILKGNQMHALFHETFILDANLVKFLLTVPSIVLKVSSELFSTKVIIQVQIISGPWQYFSSWHHLDKIEVTTMLISLTPNTWHHCFNSNLKNQGCKICNCCCHHYLFKL